MAKNMGEFEERPAVKEATPVPLQRRKPTGWIVATVAFAIVAIGAVSFIAIDKLSTKKATDSSRSEGSDSRKEEKKEEPVANLNGFAVSEEFGVIYVTKKGEVYLAPTTEKKEETAAELMRVDDYDQTKLPGKRGKYTITKDEITDFEIGSGSYAMDDYEATFDGFKIDVNNVISAFGPLTFGLGSTGYNYAFVKSDGTMAWLNLECKIGTQKASARFTETVEGYENVAAVFSASPTGHPTKVMVIKKDGGQEWMDHELLVKLVYGE